MLDSECGFDMETRPSSIVAAQTRSGSHGVVGQYVVDGSGQGLVVELESCERWAGR